MPKKLCNCDGCRIQDCDKCKFCLDKPKFGVQNKLKKDVSFELAIILPGIEAICQKCLMSSLLQEKSNRKRSS